MNYIGTGAASITQTVSLPFTVDTELIKRKQEMKKVSMMPLMQSAKDFN